MMRQFFSDTLQKIKEHPTGFWFLFWGELAERASFYGMLCLLALFMVKVLGFSKQAAGPVVHAFKMACYILPVVGGYIGDKHLGRFKTVMIFSIPYILGHVILGFFSTEVALYTALALLAIGSGAIKPNITPILGQMYDDMGKTKELRSKAFAWFYASINIGAVSSMTTLPLIRDAYGYHVAFLAPAILMAISFVIFYLGRRHYPEDTVTQKIQRSSDDKKQDWAIIKALSGIFLIIAFFFSVFSQMASTWVFFAKEHMNLYGLPADILQSLNPLLIIAFVPLFNFGWKKARDNGYDFSATSKMFVGLVIVSGCLLIMVIAGFLSLGGKVSVFWMMGAYLALTVAEMCIVIVGLELAYAESPDHMKSTMTACFLLSVALGNLMAGFMSFTYDELLPWAYFGLQMLIMVVVAFAFKFVARRFEAWKRAQTESFRPGMAEPPPIFPGE